MAKQYSALADGPQRYAILLGELNLGMGNAPFLRVRHFSRWSTIWEAIVDAIIVGLLVTSLVLEHALYGLIASRITAIPSDVLIFFREEGNFQMMTRLGYDSGSSEVQASLDSLLARRLL
jgi:hypothetical protein